MNGKVREKNAVPPPRRKYRFRHLISTSKATLQFLNWLIFTETVTLVDAILTYFARIFFRSLNFTGPSPKYRIELRTLRQNSLVIHYSNDFMHHFNTYTLFNFTWYCPLGARDKAEKQDQHKNKTNKCKYVDSVRTFLFKCPAQTTQWIETYFACFSQMSR